VSKPTTLVGPDGRRYDAPTPEAADALRAKGFRDLTEAERKDIALQKKYGEGVLPALGAAASGAASALTFGLSDVALAQTPLAEANREAVARNPTAHTLGQVVGVAAPIAAPLLGAGAAAKAAQGATAGITAVGKAATKAGELAGGAAEAIGLKAAAPVIAGAAQAAAEGAAFQLGANVGAAARRDAKLDAETLLSHVGEAAVLGAGVGAAIPLTGKAVRWSAEKALAGIEKGVQGLRAAGFGVASASVDAVDAAAGAVARNADAIGEGIAAGARGAAGVVDKAADAVVSRADDIGAAVEGAAKKVTDAADEKLLPKIREGLTKQTERPDIIDEVFATGAEGRALRQELGPQTITGTRELHSEKLGEALNDIWGQTLGNAPMFDDLARAVKKDLQAAELAGLGMSREAQAAVVKDIATEARATLDNLGKYNPTAKTYFQEAVDDFARMALENPTAESIYRGLDGLKRATDKISKWSDGAKLGDSGAAFAAEKARDFRTWAMKVLEDQAIWGGAGAVQHQINAKLAKYYSAFEQFEKQFAGAKAAGTRPRVLDGKKIKTWARDITGRPGEMKNAIVDDLIEAQTELINLTEQLAARTKTQMREALGTTPATLDEAVHSTIDHATLADVLNRSRGQAETLAGSKATAIKELDRAEVLQQTQSAILSRQGAGVNPLPVAMAQKIGGGALVGGAIGGIPGAIVGGTITSVLEKYGAITTNPKSAIQFLNTLDKLRGVDKERVSSWLKNMLGETSEAGARGAVKRAAERVDGEAIGAAVKRGAEATQAALPGARKAIESANKKAAQKILEARHAAERGIEAAAASVSKGSAGAMQRLLPAVSYADVQTAPPDEWWKRTQKAITQGQADPQRLAEKVSEDVSGLADVLPATAQEIAAQQMRVFGYLADNMPRNPRPYVLGDREWKPAPGQLKAFRDLTLVATQPNALLPLVATGAATRAQVEAVRMLWPKKFDEIRGMVMRAVTDAAAEGKPVPYSSRIRLGQMLGVPLDASQLPGFASWIQQGSAQAQQQEEQRPAVRGNFKLNPKPFMPLSMRTTERR
jgi:hypothetical protein